MTFTLKFGSLTDKGMVRDHNEDSLIVRPDLLLAAVADGMGGHNSGEIASALAVKTLAEKMEAYRTGAQQPPAAESSHSATANILLAAAIQANNAIFEAASSHPEHSGMGTTLSALALEGASASIVHIGDSRVYLLRNGAVTQITEDHSLVMEQARKGILTMEEAVSSRMQNILTRAMGLGRDSKLDLYEVELQAGDRLLLCTDGLFKAISDDAFFETLSQIEDPQTVCKQLVALANAGGGPDNITTIAIDICASGNGQAARAGSENAQPVDATARKDGFLARLLSRLFGG